MNFFPQVTDDNFYPPLCVTPVCSGNTFPPGMEAYTPKLRVPTTRINFPACSVNDNAYQVVEMYNDADTPMRFQVKQTISALEYEYLLSNFRRALTFILSLSRGDTLSRILDHVAILL